MSLEATLAILGMGLVTYITRAGGFWLIGRVTLTPRLERVLESLPGTVLIAIIAPMPFTQHWSHAFAIGLSAAFMLWLQHSFISVILAVGLTLTLRALIFS